MKKSLLLFFFVILFSSNSYAQFFVENFEYPAGDTLYKYWHSLAPLGIPNPIRITSTGLTFPSYAGSGIGNAAKLDTLDPDGVAQIFNFPGITSGSIYVSFLVSVLSAGTSGDYFMGISEAPSLGNAPLKVYVRRSSGTIAFGIGLGTLIYTPAQYIRNRTYLLILKYTFNPGPSNDAVSLFVYSTPPPSTEPSPTLGPMVPTTDLSNAFAIDLFQCYSSHSLSMTVDGIYMDQSWNNSVLPVELSSFTATINKQDVMLNWSTSSEISNSGFNVERCNVENVIENVWTHLGFVEGNGTTNNVCDYSFNDKDLNTGKYKYRLKQIDFNGNFTYYDLQNEVVIGAPDKFSLSQNYPNPFNPVTVIRYSLIESGFTGLKIYNSNGKEVETIVNQKQDAGTYEVTFNGTDLASGIYFYTLSANGLTETKRMTLLK